MTTSNATWRLNRDNCVKALRAGRPLPFCWAVYQQVLGTWQRQRGIPFVALAAYDRAAIITHLEVLI